MTKFKNLLFIIFFISLYQCGYTAVYNGEQFHNFKIIVENMDGDENFNKILNSKLRELKNNDSKNVFYIKVNSNLQKEVLAKDKAGKATNYELGLTTKFEIRNKDKVESTTFKEFFKLNSNDDSLKGKRYENNLKNNFAISIKDKLILKLNSMND